MLRLGLELLALLAGLIFIIIWVRNEKKEVVIYDFARSIRYDDKANYAIVDSDLTEIRVLAADVQDFYVTDKAEAVGKYITGDCYKGMHVQTNMLSKDPPHMDYGAVSELAGYRKYYMRVGIGDVFAGDIKSGDTVDIMFSEKASGYSTYRTASIFGADRPLNYSSSRIIMQNVPVYQVYLSNGQVYKRAITDPETLRKYDGTGGLDGKDDKKSSGGAPAYIALTVTAKQFEELASRDKMGTLSLVARFAESQDTETNGYLVMKGSYANIYAGEGNLEYNAEIMYEDKDGQNPYPQSTDRPVNTPEKAQTSIPGLYSFIRDMLKSDMSNSQRQRFNSIYTRYSDLMTKAFGTEWEINNPDSVTYEMLAANAQTQGDQAMVTLTAMKADLEALAKEIKGDMVLLPW